MIVLYVARIKSHESHEWESRKMSRVLKVVKGLKNDINVMGKMTGGCRPIFGKRKFLGTKSLKHGTLTGILSHKKIQNDTL